MQTRVKSEATLPQSTDKRIASILLIAAVELFASLLPPTTFVGHRSGPPIDALPAVWPGAGVQQDLGDVSEPVTDVAIWVQTANAFGAVVRVDASIVTGPQSLPLTQFSFEASGTALNRRILLFESYDHPPDGDVRLQLVVPEGLTIAAVFGSADQSAGLDRAIHNGDPVMNRGPLAFEFISAGPGLKAAFLGVESERSRLGLAAILLLIATTLHPSSLLLIRRFAGIAMMFIRPAFDVTTRWISFGLHSPARRSTDRPAASTPPVATRSWLFYPWIIAIYPVLHFTVSNAIKFRLVDAALVYGLSLGATTIGLLTARMLIGDFARATLVILAIQAAFFGYGHVAVLLGERAIHTTLLALFAIITTWAVFKSIAMSKHRARVVGRLLNYVAVVLIALPLVTFIRFQLAGLQALPTPLDERAAVGTAVIDAQADEIASTETLPDIYYILLDEYSRHDELLELGYDNSRFEQDLRDRGFYVVPKSTSNYINTLTSITSLLSMRYLFEFHDGGYSPEAHGATLVKISRDHAVGKILRDLGYAYIHIGSGFVLTESANDADLLVDFGSRQSIVSGPLATAGETPVLGGASVARFMREFLSTTVVSAFLRTDQALETQNERYVWYHPVRTRVTFEYLQHVPEMDRPRFVFAHVIKPHSPFNIDRFGNMARDVRFGFQDSHDPGVPSAMIGQLLFVNDQVLATVDRILDNATRPTAIVIASDHGTGADLYDPARSRNFAALRLPGVDDDVLYPTLSLVNHFRIIIEQYAGVDLPLVDDRLFVPERECCKQREVGPGA